MSKQYFIMRANQVSGPIDGAMVKSQISQGEIQANDMIGPSETGPWQPIQEITALKPLFEKVSASQEETPVLKRTVSQAVPETMISMDDLDQFTDVIIDRYKIYLKKNRICIVF